MSVFAPKSHEFGTLLFGGGVFLVFMAMVFALLEGRYLSESTAGDSNGDLERQISRGERDLADVVEGMKFERKQLEKIEERQRAYEEVRLVEGELANLKRESADLQLKILGHEESIASLSEEHQQYRGRMREWLWPQYYGRELEAENVLGDLPYQGARITDVDAAGLKVRHSSGLARIPVSNLTFAFRNELDLSVGEAKEVMMKMLLRDARGKRERSKRPAGTPNEREIWREIEVRLKQGSERATKLSELIRRAKSEAVYSRNQDRISSVRSAPGSLETWAQRAKRFESAAMKYENQLAALNLAMRELDPSFVDPGR